MMIPSMTMSISKRNFSRLNIAYVQFYTLFFCLLHAFINDWCIWFAIVMLSENIKAKSTEGKHLSAVTPSPFLFPLPSLAWPAPPLLVAFSTRFLLAAHDSVQFCGAETESDPICCLYSTYNSTNESNTSRRGSCPVAQYVPRSPVAPFLLPPSLPLPVFARALPACKNRSLYTKQKTCCLCSTNGFVGFARVAKIMTTWQHVAATCYMLHANTQLPRCLIWLRRRSQKAFNDFR